MRENLFNPFFLVAFGLFSLFYLYLGTRLIKPLCLGKTLKRAVWGLLVLLWSTSMLPFFLAPLRGGSDWADLLSMLLYVNMGHLGMALVMLFFIDIFALTLILFAQPFKLIGHHKPHAFLRRFKDRLKGAGFSLSVLSLAAFLTILGMVNALQPPQLKRVQVPIENLHPDLVGLKILQLTDLHLGDFLQEAFLRSILKASQGTEPDLITITGDLADAPAANLAPKLKPLDELKAPLGKFFVTGNHEYFLDLEGWLAQTEALGYENLINQHHLLKRGEARLLVAGITDPAAERFEHLHNSGNHKSSLSEALKEAPRHDFSLLLAHQPRGIDQAAQAGIDLQLSGHTHGGQYYPWPLLAFLFNSYLDGLHQHQGTWIYVSQGTGFWGPPLRLGTEAEVTLIELVRG